jgi:hypothetical protein
MSDVDSLDDGQFYEFNDGTDFPATGKKVAIEYANVSAMVLPGTPLAPAGRDASPRGCLACLGARRLARLRPRASGRRCGRCIGVPLLADSS